MPKRKSKNRVEITIPDGMKRELEKRVDGFRQRTVSQLIVNILLDFFTEPFIAKSKFPVIEVREKTNAKK